MQEISVSRSVTWFAVLLFLDAAASTRADEAIPFAFEPTTSADATRPVRVALDDQVAAVIEVGLTREGGGSLNNVRTYYRTNATDWIEVDMLPGSGLASAVDVDNCRMVVGLVGTAQVWAISCGAAKPGWLRQATIRLTNHLNRVAGVELEGSRIALLVDRGDGSPSPNQSVHLYDEVGTSWVFRAEVGVVMSNELSGSTFRIANAFDLSGDRLALAAPIVDTIQIHERNQGGANAWGLVASISNQPPGMDLLGYSLALDGARLAAVAQNRTNNRPHVLVYSNNTGGAGAWGFAGHLLQQPPGAGYIHLDTDGGRLAALGLPVLDGLFQAGKASTLWIYGGGAGPAGWALERSCPAGIYNWSLFDLESGSGPDIAKPSLSGTAMMLGLAGTNTLFDKSGWVASYHTADTGGAGQWGRAFAIDAPGTSRWFAHSVDMDGSFLVAGMPYDDWAGANSGSAYVWYLHDIQGEKAWFPVARLVSENGEPGDLFGWDVSVTQTNDAEARVAVGAWGELAGKGAAYVFEVSVLLGQRAPPVRIVAPTTNTSFGYAVSTGEDMLAVGAPLGDLSGLNWGTVYLFERNLGGADNWGCRKTNAAPGGSFFFGARVALSDDLLAVTKPTNPRAVYVYERSMGGANNWGLTNTITAPAGSPSEFAASAEFISPGSTLLIGATATGGSGRVYLLARQGGAYNVLLSIDDPEGDGRSFGSSVAWVDFGGALVGAPLAGPASNGVARLFGFSLAGGVTSIFTIASIGGGAANDRLGTDVAGGRIYAVAGAPLNDANGTDAGMLRTIRAGSYEIWAGSQPPAFAAAWKPWEDYDLDADANLMEFAMGTDPMDAGSTSRLRMSRRTAPPPPVLAWEVPDPPYSTQGLFYRMQTSDDATRWNTASYDLTATNGVTSRLFELDEPWRWYRLAPQYPVFGGGGGGIIIVP